ncbi:GumC domain-containing protein [Mastigocoleus testarum]|uniref:Uncharacterized protein n=1 Tax=Mastigocoleus testarum BC008 TaxID=371196 RepID=A0A0V7ZFE5_9CYAN|nr:hypothetical protein [Mastigocoleus testarum]KST63300.1 hypothetical protein BC008_39140 [Mastigocoleus testarum BC008]
MPKPTILIALDPHSAALCAAIEGQLQQLPTVQSHLIQTYTLTWDGQVLGFSKELDRFADGSFELKLKNPKQASVSQLSQQFEQGAKELQTTLIDLIKSVNQSPEVIAARNSGVDISSWYRIYIMFSASDPWVRELVFDLSRLIHWLFNIYFTDIPHSLEALLLLPGLFAQAKTEHYAAAYQLLKELDEKMTKGVVISGAQKKPPFDNCWLIDERIGELGVNLDSYADAFAGFLTAEPETGGLLIGTHTVRGKIPAYSTFGYGELLFPAQTVIDRLSSTLAADILSQEFLPQAKFTPEAHRQLLLNAKEFVLSEDYNDALQQLERDNGKPVWQDFNPRLDIRPGKVQEYGIELERAYKQFEDTKLLSYKRTLENCGKKTQAKLTELLDLRINQYVDAVTNGLQKTVRLSNILTNPYLELQTEFISDRPENLVTELRTAEALLDSRLHVAINKENSQKLLEQVFTLKSQQQQLKDNLTQGNLNQNNLTQDNLTDPNSETVIEELDKIQEQLKIAVTEYHQAINAEIEQARQTRLTAIDDARAKTYAAINQRQKLLNSLENQHETATDRLNELITEEKRFRSLYLVTLPVVVVIFLIGILVVTGLFSQSKFWSLLQHIGVNLLNYLLLGLVATLTYSVVIWLKYSSGIRQHIQKVRKQVERLESSLKATAVELRHSYNDQLKLEYELYAQNIRVETLNYLIKITKQKTEVLRQTLSNLSRIHENLINKRDQLSTNSSETRLAVLTTSDIDTYYHQNFPSTLSINKFSREEISRSQSWQITATEFRQRLLSFSKKQFENLSQLSIGEVLKSDLIANETANVRLNQLSHSAKILLRLQDSDAHLNPTSQPEITLWVGAKDKEEILQLYSRFSRSITPIVAENEGSLRVLVRSLGFPVYFLSQIEFYRDCYERNHQEPSEQDNNIPDLIPEEISSSGELNGAYDTLLLAIALELVSQNARDNYQFNNQPLGKEREKIASALTTEFTHQELYGELKERIESFENHLIYQQLEKLEKSAKDLTHYERKRITQLLSNYNPLN